MRVGYRCVARGCSANRQAFRPRSFRFFFFLEKMVHRPVAFLLPAGLTSFFGGSFSASMPWPACATSFFKREFSFPFLQSAPAPAPSFPAELMRQRMKVCSMISLPANHARWSRLVQLYITPPAKYNPISCGVCRSFSSSPTALSGS